MRRSLLTSLCLALTATGTAVAQSATPPVASPIPSLVELGLFGRYAGYMKNEMDANAGFGGGARLGVHLFGPLAAEGEYFLVQSTTSGGTDLTNSGGRIRLAYHQALSPRWRMILGAGWTIEGMHFGDAFDARNSANLGALLGLQANFNDVFGLRVDGTYDAFTPLDDVAPGDSVVRDHSGPILGLQFGLSMSLGKRRPADADGDGVPDIVDACAGTPAGERIDARGCPLPHDADGDGVVDASDRCANTAAGTAVDATGCPRDTDRDGVPDAADRCSNTAVGTTVDATGCPVDTDNDGVLNTADRCPNTPPHDQVDATGCSRDTDADGVPDTADQCARTPAGTAVDEVGCPRDTDHDGVNDTADMCPNTAAGTTVDATGCARDSDGDGVPDSADRCASPAGARVDAVGCTLPDSDRDGVVDPDDKCPGTPIGTQVDANGCQQLFDTRSGRTSLVLRGVTFASGTAQLTAGSRPILDGVGEALVANPTVRVEVQGYTDSRGTRAANLRLSQSRADAVRAYLIDKGVEAGRLTAVGYGPDNPVVPNTTAANRARNRRVELKQLP